MHLSHATLLALLAAVGAPLSHPSGLRDLLSTVYTRGSKAEGYGHFCNRHYGCYFRKEAEPESEADSLNMIERAIAAGDTRTLMKPPHSSLAMQKVAPVVHTIADR